MPQIPRAERCLPAQIDKHQTQCTSHSWRCFSWANILENYLSTSTDWGENLKPPFKQRSAQKDLPLRSCNGPDGSSIEQNWRQPAPQYGGGPSKAAADWLMGLLLCCISCKSSFNFAKKKIKQNCSSGHKNRSSAADSNTRRNTAEVGFIAPQPKTKLIKTIRCVNSEESTWADIQCIMNLPQRCHHSVASQAAGHADLRTPLHLLMTPIDPVWHKEW